jgi:hypothetical protein
METMSAAPYQTDFAGPTRFRFTPLAILLISLLLGGTRIALAGPNEGGVLMVHANPSIEYTYSTDYCGQSALSACDDAVVSVSGPELVVFYILAAFHEEAHPSLKGVTFGIQYSDSLTIVDYGSCASLQVPTPSWPASGEGNALTWAYPQISSLTEMYWFAAYSYSGRPQTFSVSGHPTHGAYFGDDSVPSELDAVAAFGTLGFDTAGNAPCPSTPVYGPRTLEYPFTLAASTSSPNVIFVDPGTDDLIQLCFRRPLLYEPPDTLILHIAVTSPKTDTSIGTYDIQVGASTVYLTPIVYSRGDGLAAVEISATKGDGLSYELFPRESGSTDGIFLNEALLALTYAADYELPFWVPHSAQGFRLSLMDNPSRPDSADILIEDPTGEQTVGNTGHTYEFSEPLCANMDETPAPM